VTIGEGAMIAAGVLVLSDVPTGHTAIGVPLETCRDSKVSGPAKTISARVLTAFGTNSMAEASRQVARMRLVDRVRRADRSASV
jgi:serine acetyltransferase